MSDFNIPHSVAERDIPGQDDEPLDFDALDTGIGELLEESAPAERLETTSRAAGGVVMHGAETLWSGCGECDCAFPCYDGAARCLRLHPIAPHHLNAARTVAVSAVQFWEPMQTCPRGVKVQLLNAGGVAVYGVYDGRDPFWEGWAPVPRRREA